MVDFRYHIVSIVAIFLALAVGIVLGAGPLKTTSDAQLKTQVSDLRTTTRTLQGSLAQAQAEVQFLDRFGAQVAPALLSNRLAGLKVAVVSLPGADPALAAGVVTSLKQANAIVAVQASVTSSWTDPGHQAALAAALAVGEATATPTPTGPIGGTPAVRGSGSPVPSPASSSQLASASATVYSDVAAELAAGLLTSAALPTATHPTIGALPTGAASVSPARAAGSTAPPAGTGRSAVGTTTGAGAVASDPPSTSPPATAPAPAAVAARTLAALVSAGFVSLSGAVPQVHPTLAVVLAADPPATATDTSRAANAELATLANALRAGSDGTVLAGSGASAGDGGLLALIRASRPTAGELSTVDSVDTVVGRIAVPLALVQQQSAGRVGQYGSVGSTDGPLPLVNGIGPG